MNFAVATIFSLTLFSNVVVLLTTRTDSVLFGTPKSSTAGGLSLRNSPKYSLDNLAKFKDGENIGGMALGSST
jgi:hypothetical protein